MLLLDLRRLVALALMTGAVAVASAQSQSRELNESSGTQVVSPSVVATWFTRNNHSDTASLDLLVLWRGTPGWFLKGGVNGDRTSGDLSGVTVVHVLRGGLDLELVLDSQARTVRVQRATIELRGGNVVLVDQVDAAAGLKIVGTRTVDGQISGEMPVRVGTVLKRSTELVSFLQCGMRLPDSTVQKTIDLLCAQVTGK